MLHYRKFPITDLPRETDALTKWMNDRFVEKEQMLEIFYKTGQFPKWDEQTRSVHGDILLDPTPVYFSAKTVLLANVLYAGVLIATVVCLVYPLCVWIGVLF